MSEFLPDYTCTRTTFPCMPSECESALGPNRCSIRTLAAGNRQLNVQNQELQQQNDELQQRLGQEVADRIEAARDKLIPGYQTMDGLLVEVANSPQLVGHTLRCETAEVDSDGRDTKTENDEYGYWAGNNKIAVIGYRQLQVTRLGGLAIPEGRHMVKRAKPDWVDRGIRRGSGDEFGVLTYAPDPATFDEIIVERIRHVFSPTYARYLDDEIGKVHTLDEGGQIDPELARKLIPVIANAAGVHSLELFEPYTDEQIAAMSPNRAKGEALERVIHMHAVAEARAMATKAAQYTDMWKQARGMMAYHRVPIPPIPDTPEKEHERLVALNFRKYCLRNYNRHAGALLLAAGPEQPTPEELAKLQQRILLQQNSARHYDSRY